MDPICKLRAHYK